ncbi:hypothetical protein HDV02_000035 [Globomyces sp. JEL0801]|nr:hypothetical protein HDV02_000035 [Globomyces sp. JEL0801]
MSINNAEINFESSEKLNKTVGKKTSAKQSRDTITTSLIQKNIEQFANETNRRRRLEIERTIQIRREINQSAAKKLMKSNNTKSKVFQIKPNQFAIAAEWNVLDTRPSTGYSTSTPMLNIGIYSDEAEEMEQSIQSPLTLEPITRPQTVLDNLIESEHGANDEETQKSLHVVDLSPLKLDLPTQDYDGIMVEEERKEGLYITGQWTQSSRSASRASNKLSRYYDEKLTKAGRIRSARKPFLIEPTFVQKDISPQVEYLADSNGKSLGVYNTGHEGIMLLSSQLASFLPNMESNYLSSSLPEYPSLEIRKQNTKDKLHKQSTRRILRKDYSTGAVGMGLHDNEKKKMNQRRSLDFPSNPGEYVLKMKPFSTTALTCIEDMDSNVLKQSVPDHLSKIGITAEEYYGSSQLTIDEKEDVEDVSYERSRSNSNQSTDKPNILLRNLKNTSCRSIRNLSQSAQIKRPSFADVPGSKRQQSAPTRYSISKADSNIQLIMNTKINKISHKMVPNKPCNKSNGKKHGKIEFNPILSNLLSHVSDDVDLLGMALPILNKSTEPKSESHHKAVTEMDINQEIKQLDTLLSKIGFV